MKVDLYPIFRRSPRGAFNNFFKSSGFLEAKAYLESRGLSEPDILTRSRGSGPGGQSVALAHPLIALEFMRWHDSQNYFSRLDSALGLTKPIGE